MLHKAGEYGFSSAETSEPQFSENPSQFFQHQKLNLSKAEASTEDSVTEGKFDHATATQLGQQWERCEHFDVGSHLVHFCLHLSRS